MKRLTVPHQATHFTLVPGFAKTQEGTAATIIHDMAEHCGPAVILLDAEAAAPWLQNPQTFDHPLALMVLGTQCKCALQDACTTMHIPAHDAAHQPVVLSVCAHQLGKKAIRFGHDAVGKVAVADTRPCVFNVFRDDCSQDLWTQVLAAPVKTALGLFQEGTAVLCGKPWKRRWVCQAKECEPTRAELFAFTGFLRTQSLEKILFQSGLNHVFVQPITPIEVAKEPYVILPLAEARASALLLIKKIPEHKGLTRTRKGYGARLSEADYPAVWTRLFPN